MSNKITYRREKGSQLSSHEVDDNFSYLDERIDKVAEKDYIIYDAGYSHSTSAVTVNSGCKWKISGTEYSNAVDMAFGVQVTSKGMYRVDVVYFDKTGVVDIKTGTENGKGYEKARTEYLEYLIVYVNEAGVQSVNADAGGDYVSKLSYAWVDVDHDKAVLEATEQRAHINIVGGNKIIDTIANGIFEISVPEGFHDGYEVAIRNLRTSYVTLVHSNKLRIYTGQSYTLRPGEIVTFRYDKKNKAFAVSGALDIRLDWQNVDEIIGVDSMRMVVDSSAGDALNPNDLNTKLTPMIMRYFKDYTSDAVGWQWARFSGDETADKEWAKGKTKRVLELTPADFTDAIHKSNVSFMCEAVVNAAVVTGVWVGKLVDTAKTIRIQSTGTQFKGKSPEYILLRAIANNIQVKKTEWFRDDILTNINDSVMVYNNQVSSWVVMKLRVTGVDGVVYEDAITLSKVVDGTDGKPGADGKQGAAVIWTEWMTGSKHYNNEKEIYYIYHRPTQTVWKLKDGYNDIVAPANPDSRYVSQPHLEQVVTKVLVAEGANIAGFIFKNGKMVSQYPSPDNPDLTLDGTNGEIIAKKLTIAEGSPAAKFIDDKIGGIEVGGRNLLLNSNSNYYKYITSNNHTVMPMKKGQDSFGYWISQSESGKYQIDTYFGRVISQDTDVPVFSDVFKSLSFGSFYLCSVEVYCAVEIRVGMSGGDNPPNNPIFTVKPDTWTRIYALGRTVLANGTTRPGSIYARTNWGDNVKIPLETKLYIRNYKIEEGNKPTPWTPAVEDVEAKIIDQEMYVEYSVNGISAWHTPATTSDRFMRQKKGNGTWSVALPFGKDGINGSNGKDGTNGKDGSKGDTGVNGKDGNNGTPGKDGKYSLYNFAKNTSLTVAPTAGWTALPPALAVSEYLWQRIGDVIPPATQPTTWQPAVRISGPAGSNGKDGDKGAIGPAGKDGVNGVQGLQGVKGDQGIAGVKGADGQTSYTHIAYADTSVGGGFNQNPVGKTYIGMYVDFISQDSTDPNKYKWSLIKGADGKNGIAGSTGADGKTPYFHTAWATNATGTAGFSTTVSTDKTHIGTYTDFVQSDSTDPKRYSWSQIKGDKGNTGDKGATGSTGANGSNGKDGKYTLLQYAKNTSTTVAPTVGFVENPPTLSSNEFLWMRKGEVTPPATAPASWTTPVRVSGLHGQDGQKGDRGPEGIQGPVGEPLGDGVMLFTDPDFSFGTNSMSTYVAVSPVRVIRADDVPTKSTHMMRMTNTGQSVSAADQRRAGYVQLIASRANAVFIHKIIAKFPVGHRLSYHNNTIGTGGSFKWLTSDMGTGRFETYIYKLTCGHSGPFTTSAAGYVAFNGPAGTAAAPVNYDIAYSTIFDMSIPDRRLDFLTTQIDAKSVVTATLLVGQGTAATAGVTGVRASGQSSNVAFWAGLGYENRESAAFRVWTDGRLFATQATVSGTINANAGTFNNVTANNLTVNSGKFTGEVNMNKGTIGGLKLENGMLTSMSPDNGIILKQYWDGIQREIFIGTKDFITGGGYSPSISLKSEQKLVSSRSLTGLNIQMMTLDAKDINVVSRAIILDGGWIAGMAQEVQYINGGTLGSYVSQYANIVICENDNTMWLELPSVNAISNGYIIEIRCMKGNIRVLKGPARLIRESANTSYNEYMIRSGTTSRVIKYGDSWYIL